MKIEERLTELRNAVYDAAARPGFAAVYVASLEAAIIANWNAAVEAMAAVVAHHNAAIFGGQQRCPQCGQPQGRHSASCFVAPLQSALARMTGLHETTDVV